MLEPQVVAVTLFAMQEPAWVHDWAVQFESIVHCGSTSHVEPVVQFDDCTQLIVPLQLSASQPPTIVPHHPGRDIPPGLVRKILADARLSGDDLR